MDTLIDEKRLSQEFVPAPGECPGTVIVFEDDDDPERYGTVAARKMKKEKA